MKRWKRILCLCLAVALWQPVLGEYAHAVFLLPHGNVNSEYDYSGCSKCGSCYYHEIMEFQYNNDGTCIDPGTMTGTCDFCGCTETVAYDGLWFKEHWFGEYVSNNDAQCLYDGSKSARCLLCGELDTVRDPNTMLGHDFGEGVSNADATCTQPGTVTYTCARCGWKIVETEQGISGHNFGEWKQKRAPTCVEEGLQSRVCRSCGCEEQARLPLTGHTEIVLDAIPAGCTGIGLTEGRGCGVCGMVISAQQVIPATGHSYAKTRVEATCTGIGYTGYTCRNCGSSYMEDLTEPLGHSFSKWQIEKEPEGQLPGIKIRICDCGTEEREEFYSSFLDVPCGKYFSKPVFWAYENGITTGKTEDSFQLDGPCTRKQVVMFLWRAAGQPKPENMENPFTDVAKDRFEKAILWAYYEGITTGKTATEFRPEETCTREQILMFLWRFHGCPDPESMKHPFTDVKTDRFEKAILWAYHNRITNGRTADEFRPKEECTRGQIVTFLYRDMVG